VGVGLTDTAAERRMALRLSHERLQLLGGAPPAPAPRTTQDVADLPTVQWVTAALATTTTTTTAAAGGEEPWSRRVDLPTQRACPDEDAGGDDDEEAECDAAAPGDPAEVSDEEFYADVMDSA
jgi:hypothetical protein